MLPLGLVSTMSQQAKSPLLLYPQEVALAVDAASRDEAVADRYHIAYIVMYLLGIAALTPWNAMITPIDYLHLRVAGSAFEQSFESVLTTSFTCIAFSTLLCMQKLQGFVSIQARVVFPLLLLIAIFSVLTGLALAPLGLPDAELLDSLEKGASSQFFALVGSGMLCGVGQAILTGSSMAYASLFASGPYLQAVSVGNGIAGLGITLASLFIALPGFSADCKDNGHQSAEALLPTLRAAPLVSDSAQIAHARETIRSAALYFGVSVVVLTACLISFFVVESLPFTKARKRMNARAASSAASSSSSPATYTTGMDGGGSHEQGVQDSSCLQGACVVAHSSSGAPRDLQVADTLHGTAPLGGVDTAGTSGTASGAGDLRMDEQSSLAPRASPWQFAISIALVYSVTISIFPSLTSTIIAAPYTNSSEAHNEMSLAVPARDGRGAFPAAWCEWSHLFVPLGFVLFNLGDMIGRASPCILRSPTGILLVAVSRITFGPLFMLCHTAQGGGLQLPLFWGTDVMPFVFIACFSVTNGWLTSSIFVSMAERITDAATRESCTTLVVTMLNGGICMGAALSFLVRYLDCTKSPANDFDCNPFISPPFNASAG